MSIGENNVTLILKSDKERKKGLFKELKMV
jgi:hypothetical protein